MSNWTRRTLELGATAVMALTTALASVAWRGVALVIDQLKTINGKIGLPGQVNLGPKPRVLAISRWSPREADDEVANVFIPLG